MVDLSKELGEIKRRHKHDVFRSPCPEKAHNDRARLLSIIETEIPGMLRERADELDKLPDGPYDDGRLQGGIDELRAAAYAIESLTKNETSARSSLSDGVK